MAREQALYPACALELEPTDPGYVEGFRFRIDQLDGEQMLAVTRERMNELFRLHGFRQVTIVEMEQLRKGKPETK